MSTTAVTAPVPQDIDAERQVLGALLVRPELFVPVSSILAKDDFFLEAHQLIYSVVDELSNSGGEIDPVRIVQRLDDLGSTTRVGGGTYVIKLAQDVHAPANAPAHARRLKQIAVRRSLMDVMSHLREQASTPHEDESAFLKTVEDEILKITNKSFSQGVFHVRELKEEFKQHIAALAESKGRMTGTATHFTEFDNLTSGLKGGELIVLAARPSVGKTTLAMNIAANVALQEKKHVLIFSLEMSRLELLMRLLCSEAMIHQGDLKTGNIQGKVPLILRKIEDIFSAPMSIDDTGTVDIWDVIARTRKLAVDLSHRGESLGLIVIDYLQLVSDPGSRKLGRQQEVAQVSRSLKQLAKNVNAPVIAISQMNRSVEQRRGDSARPQLSDLRESGAIEQDADIVMFIHKEQYDENDPSQEAMDNRGTVEIILAKHRNGAVGSFRLAFAPQFNKFTNRAAT